MSACASVLSLGGVLQDLVSLSPDGPGFFGGSSDYWREGAGVLLFHRLSLPD
jgi:hypothetical protein